MGPLNDATWVCCWIALVPHFEGSLAEKVEHDAVNVEQVATQLGVNLLVGKLSCLGLMRKMLS